LIQRGVPSGKIEVIYNWSHEDSSPAPRDLSPRADEATLAGRFNIIFAGNMGTAQGLDTVIGAARQIQDEIPEVQFVLVGDGVEASRIKKLARDRGVANVRFMARRPVEEMRWLLARADGLLIHLKDSPLSRIGIPQKTQAYLAAGKPILMAVRGDSADLVRQARAGLVCEPENPGSLSQAVRALFSMPASDRDAMGRNGREFYSKKLGFRVGLSKMLMVFQEAVGDHNP
jgi:glycosyltransferase involved in cell wall biosynthesis